jgi:AcrR family transcriptional regulator
MATGRGAKLEKEAGLPVLRRRLALGWSESIATRGYCRTSVHELIASARLSRSTFYKCFGGKEESFVLVHGEALACLTSRLGTAIESGAAWQERVADAVRIALEEVARRPCEAQLLVGEPLAAGPRQGYCQELLIARFAPALAVGRSSSTLHPPPTTETAVLGGLIAIVSNRLRTGEAATLPAMAPELIEFVLAPYIGPEQARSVAYARAAS